eukprot:jgi/Orpsp1_1/1187842/evm.model.d7180000060548.1
MIASNSKSVNNSMSLVQKKAETKKRHPKKVTASEGSSSIKYINNSDIVTQLGNALVREYLSRHGCKKSLSALTEFDEKELSENSKKTYNSRTELAKSLGILKHAQQNKSSKTVYLSLLEVAINAVLLDLVNNSKEEKNNNKSTGNNSKEKEKEKSSHSSKHKDAEKNNYPYTSSTSINSEHHSEHENRKTKVVVNPSSSINSHSSQQANATTISVAKASPAASSYSITRITIKQVLAVIIIKKLVILMEIIVIATILVVIVIPYFHHQFHFLIMKQRVLLNQNKKEVQLVWPVILLQFMMTIC